MEHQKADVRPVTGSGVSGDDDTARFLRELRQLRDGAGLGHAQLAARAHYPYDSIVAAELGPALPDLPVLSAFVRGCGGPTQEWEERWRSLTSSPSLPVPETRQTGQSDAANAGARINSTAPAGDGPDPSVILAALNRVAEEMASPGAEPVPVLPAAQQVPDLPPSAFSSPSSSFAGFSSGDFSSGDFSSGEAEAVARPAGWDPIRVSSAWPALKHTPTMDEPAGVPGGAGSPGGAGAPWGTAAPPWAEDPADALAAPAAASSSAADSTVAGTGTASAQATDGTPAAVTGAASRGGPGRSWLIAIVLIGLVLLCGAVALLVTVG